MQRQPTGGVTPLEAVVAAVLLIVAAMVALYPLFEDHGAPLEGAARYYPADTVVFAWVNLYPESGQRAHMNDLLDRLNEIPAFREEWDRILDNFRTEYGLDLEADLVTWIGPELSFGLIRGADGDDWSFAFTAQVRDRAAAEHFVTRWEGFDDLHLDLSDDLLVAAVDPPTLARMLEQIAAGRATSLAADPDFLAARTSSPGPRTGSVYVALRELVDLGADAATATGREILPVPDTAGPDLDELMPDWLWVTTSWADRALVSQIVAPLPPNRAAWPSAPSAAEWASLWPQGTLLIYAASFDPRLDYLSDFYSDEQLQELDELLAEASESLGLDLREDVLSLLSGEFAIGLQAVDPGWLSEISVENPVDAAVLASYRPERIEDVRATMSRVRELIADLGAEWATADIGAVNPAWLVPLQDEAGWAPGYVLHDGWLAVGSTERTLRKFVAVREGAASSLAQDPEYVRATDPLPSQLSFLFYADLSEWSRMLLGQAQDDTFSQWNVLPDVLGRLALGGTIDDGYVRITSVVTLFPD